VLGIRVLRKIFGHKSGEVTGKWTILHNGGGIMICILITKYYSGDKNTKNVMGGDSGTNGEDRRLARVLVGVT
jgi:hypothetical protein